jgi:hypothetical protein
MKRWQLLRHLLIPSAAVVSYGVPECNHRFIRHATSATGWQALQLQAWVPFWGKFVYPFSSYKRTYTANHKLNFVCKGISAPSVLVRGNSTNAYITYSTYWLRAHREPNHSSRIVQYYTKPKILPKTQTEDSFRVSDLSSYNYLPK